MPSSRHIKVFVASPSDVNVERDALEHVIDDLNIVWGPRKNITLQMLDWRKHVALWFGKPPERELLEQLSVQSWDLFISIFWNRFGTQTGDLNPDTGEPFRSGTEQEFFLAYKCYQKFNKPRMLVYRCTRGVDPSKVDPKQIELLQEFFEEFKLGGKYHGSYISYEEITEFTDNVRRNLQIALWDLEEHEVPRPSLVESVDNVPDNKVAQWLSKVKLVGNPFSCQQGDIDDNLPKYFHSSTSLPPIGELINSRKPVIIFGSHGSGKSTLRQSMMYYSRHLNGQSVLTIPYTDFAYLAEKVESGDKITPRMHTQEIIKAGIQALVRDIQKGDVNIPSTVTEDERLELWKYASCLGYDLSRPDQRLLSDTLKVNSESGADLGLPKAYTDMFYGFCKVVRICGYDAVWVLVDRVDENPPIVSNVELALQILIPLLTDLQLMTPSYESAAFRFFLSLDFRKPLKADPTVRLQDRFASHILTWTSNDLSVLIEKRMRAFTDSLRHEPYTRLGELSTSEIYDIDKTLVKWSRHNPRNLMMLCDFVISEHCKQPISDDNLLLTEADLENAKRRFDDKVCKVIVKPPFSPVDSLPTPLAVEIARYRDEQDTVRKVALAHLVTQSILQFIGCCMLSLYWRSAGRKPSLDQALRGLVGDVKSPPSLGDWQQLINRIAGIKAMASHTLMKAFMTFVKSKTVRANLADLIRMRNAFSHGQTGIDEGQMLHQLREVDVRLQQVLDALEPLEELALLTVEGHNIDENRKLVHKMQVHQGNVLVPRREDIITAENFKRGEVLLYEQQARVAEPLSPFVVFESAPVVRDAPPSRELWVLDRLVGTKRDEQCTVQYVSFISSSTACFDMYVAELEALGFIPTPAIEKGMESDK
ncbi:MAG: hypothetical protein H8E40_11105 [Chloroflexi bacterium]|nr:hypothetical protein [Chloroflexota bacterium]